MKLHMRLDHSDAGHTQVTVFVNGANCGHLTLRTQGEVVPFLMIVRHGLSPTMDEYRESGELYNAPGSGLTHAGVPISRADHDRISRDGP